MKKLIFATGNEGKMREIRAIMAAPGLEILSQDEAGFHPEVVEDGRTFEENAIIKAKAIAELCPEALVLADDSGLEVDYLNKEPGVYSARWGGENTSYVIKNQMLLERLYGVPKEKRTARFVCAIAAVVPGGQILTTRAAMEGFIGEAPAGENGFGYDPIFQVPEYGCSSAELTMEQKNKLSHRGKALEQMKVLLREKVEKAYENFNC